MGETIEIGFETNVEHEGLPVHETRVVALQSNRRLAAARQWLQRIDRKMLIVKVTQGAEGQVGVFAITLELIGESPGVDLEGAGCRGREMALLDSKTMACDAQWQYAADPAAALDLIEIQNRECGFEIQIADREVESAFASARIELGIARLKTTAEGRGAGVFDHQARRLDAEA